MGDAKFEEEISLAKDAVANTSTTITGNNGKKLTTRGRILKTLTAYYCYTIHGAINALLGATLMDLQKLLNSDTREISTIFTWRYVGMLFGCLVSGRVADRVNQHLLQATALLLMGVCLATAPWCQNFVTFSVVIGIQGFFSGSHTVGSHAFIIDLWGEKSGPFVQALQFVVMVGATACPQIAKLFLASNQGMNQGSMGHLNETSYENGNSDYDHHSLKTEELLNGSFGSNDDVNANSFQLATSSNTEFTGRTSNYDGNFTEYKGIYSNSSTAFLTAGDAANIRYLYLLLSGLALLGALFHVINIICSGCDWRHINNNSKQEWDSKTSKKRNGEAKSESSVKPHTIKYYSIMALFLLCAIVVCFAGIEEIFGAFLITFSVNQLKWESSSSRDLVSVFWGSAGISRLLSTFLSVWVKPKVLLAMYVFSSASVTITLTFTSTHSEIVMWVGTVLVGLSIGSLIATTLGMGKDFLRLSGELSSVVFVSVFIGKIGTPALIGYIMQEVGFIWFLYLAMIFAMLMVFFYCSLLVLAFVDRKVSTKDTKSEISEHCALA